MSSLVSAQPRKISGVASADVRDWVRPRRGIFSLVNLSLIFIGTIAYVVFIDLAFWISANDSSTFITSSSLP